MKVVETEMEEMVVRREEVEAGQGAGRRAGSFGSEEERAEPIKTSLTLEAAASRSRGPWRRVTLSARDWEVLAWAHEQKFLMFDQVARWFPAGAENPHAPRKEAPTPGTLRRRARPGNWYVLERLRKLVRFDVLTRVPVYTEAAGALLPGKRGFELLIGSGRSSGLARSTRSTGRTSSTTGRPPHSGGCSRRTSVARDGGPSACCGGSSSRGTSPTAS